MPQFRTQSPGPQTWFFGHVCDLRGSHYIAKCAMDALPIKADYPPNSWTLR
jgi:hypothetical protein